MNRKFSVIFILMFAVLILGISTSAYEPWFTYDPDAAPSVVASIYRARINEDYSLSVTISVLNAGETISENVSLSEISVTFGSNVVYFNDQITGKSIKPGVQKKYTLKAKSDAFWSELTDEDLKTCQYRIKGSYACGEYWHEFTVNTTADMIMWR